MCDRNDLDLIEKKEVTYDFSVCEELEFELFELSKEENQVIVHVKVNATIDEDAARIWKTTFLVDAYSGVKYPLVYSDGISIAPEWTPIPSDKPLYFTLIFKGLPKKCLFFHLVEIIPEPGGFEFKNIQRNISDVYAIEF